MFLKKKELPKTRDELIWEDIMLQFLQLKQSSWTKCFDIDATILQLEQYKKNYKICKRIHDKGNEVLNRYEFSKLGRVLGELTFIKQKSFVRQVSFAYLEEDAFNAMMYVTDVKFLKPDIEIARYITTRAFQANYTVHPSIWDKEVIKRYKNGKLITLEKLNQGKVSSKAYNVASVSQTLCPLCSLWEENNTTLKGSHQFERAYKNALRLTKERNSL